MASKFESSIREIPYSQSAVYGMLSDLSNIEKIKGKLPEDKIKDLVFDADSLSIHSPIGKIALQIIEKEAPKCIKFETRESMMPFNLWIQIAPISDASCKIKLTVKAELNPFIKTMVQKPLQEGIEKIADVLELIHYE